MRFSILVLFVALVGILEARYLLKYNFEGKNPHPIKNLKGFLYIFSFFWFIISKISQLLNKKANNGLMAKD